mgnify:CR=1 FL=1
MFEAEHFICGKRVDVQPTMTLEEKYQKVKKSHQHKIFISKVPTHLELWKIADSLSEYCEVWSCNFINPKGKTRAIVQAELADSDLCEQLSKKGIKLQGPLYNVTLYKPKAAWNLYFERQDNNPLGTVSSLSCEKHALLNKSFAEQSVLKIIQKRSRRIDQSISNYRFNISVTQREINMAYKPVSTFNRGGAQLNLTQLSQDDSTNCTQQQLAANHSQYFQSLLNTLAARRRANDEAL